MLGGAVLRSALTLDSGAELLLLVAGFPVVAPAVVGSAFPRSPPALPAAGRTDFFMPSSATATRLHQERHLWTQDRGAERACSPDGPTVHQEAPESCDESQRSAAGGPQAVRRRRCGLSSGLQVHADPGGGWTSRVFIEESSSFT